MKNNQDKNDSKDKKGGSLFWSILEGLTFDNKSSKSSNDELMPWEEDAIKNDGYESHNFEEEELEEDDYYYEDDK